MVMSVKDAVPRTAATVALPVIRTPSAAPNKPGPSTANATGETSDAVEDSSGGIAVEPPVVPTTPSNWCSVMYERLPSHINCGRDGANNMSETGRMI